MGLQNQLKEVDLNGIKFDVEFVKNLIDHQDICGQIQHYTHKIIIDDSMHDDETVATLWHEIIEGMNRQFDIGLEHHQIEILEGTLAHLTRTNPQLFHTLGAVYDKGKATQKKTKQGPKVMED